VEIQLHALTLALDGGELSASSPGRLKSPRHPLDRLGGSQRRSWRGGEEKKIPYPAGNRTPVVQAVD
jgi:hypothetical protein